MSVNKVIIIGRLGQEPELKYTPSGAAVCNFSVATSENWTDKNGQRQERTEWHRIVVWGKLAELCNQYLGKGRQAFIEGKLQTRSWDDKDGNKRYTTEVLATTVQFLGGANANVQNQGQGQNQYGAGASPNPNMSSNQGVSEPEIVADSSFAADDIPF